MDKETKLKCYNVTLDVFFMEHIYEIEAKNKKEAVEIAKDKSDWGRSEGAELKLFEIEEIKVKLTRSNEQNL